MKASKTWEDVHLWALVFAHVIVNGALSTLLINGHAMKWEVVALIAFLLPIASSLAIFVLKVSSKGDYSWGEAVTAIGMIVFMAFSVFFSFGYAITRWT